VRVCFVDLTGYTRLTEEQGDAAAAELAGRLAALVEGISRRYGGRPVRWLGDGGMFVFREPAAAVWRPWRWSPCPGQRPRGVAVLTWPSARLRSDNAGAR
jgi:class 3 adenylate cyclase